VTAINSTPEAGRDLGGLAALPGLEVVAGQLGRWVAVLRAEQARRRSGAVVGRQTWKNLIFTGGSGSGKSRAARAIARIYMNLGILEIGHLDEVAAATLVGATSRETETLLSDAVSKAVGSVLMITGVHAWRDLPDRGEQMLARLYRELTDSRNHRGDQLAVILAGHKDPVVGLLGSSPPLAARFPVVIDFPGYTPGQLAAIFATLASETGFTLTPAADRNAAAVLAQTAGGHGPGNARLAVQLLDQATASQARRIADASQPPDPGLVNTITEADIPGDLQPRELHPDDQWPGQYL
jgi:AAA lid domain/ATPase family associated with various cellular activities (AAA)